MRRPLRVTAGVALLAAATPLLAQTVYVDDRIEVGIHEGRSPASTILVLVPSGTPLELLERAGDLARVQAPDGASGWVDARFLSDTPPGRTRLQALETELAGAQAALADTQAKLVALENDASARAAAGGSDEGVPSETLREMQTLAQENQRLKQQVAELQAMQRMALEQQQAAGGDGAPPAAPAETPPPAAPEPLSGWQRWHVLLLASILLLAFAAGGWLVDWGIRRRHGGFRV